MLSRPTWRDGGGDSALDQPEALARDSDRIPRWRFGLVRGGSARRESVIVRRRAPRWRPADPVAAGRAVRRRAADRGAPGSAMARPAAAAGRPSRRPWGLASGSAATTGRP